MIDFTHVATSISNKLTQFCIQLMPWQPLHCFLATLIVVRSPSPGPVQWCRVCAAPATITCGCCKVWRYCSAQCRKVGCPSDSHDDTTRNANNKPATPSKRSQSLSICQATRKARLVLEGRLQRVHGRPPYASRIQIPAGKRKASCHIGPILARLPDTSPYKTHKNRELTYVDIHRFIDDTLASLPMNSRQIARFRLRLHFMVRSTFLLDLQTHSRTRYSFALFLFKFLI
jgi:hypothetical protein